MTNDDQDLAEVVRREQRLLDPHLRARSAEVDELLHPQFMEHGASGRVWDRQTMIDAMSADPAVSGAATDFVAVKLAPDVVLLTYRVLGSAGSLRSSVWVREPGPGWQVRFHQGTRSPNTPAE